ncbi:MAG: 30S ribosomal protein S11 [Candidatus Harrisonbacteria bacterium]|nr:30S ribosomal protein S11 [Candidatus Harrisonbacteria bacterium]
MGKKKVAAESQEEVLKQGEAVETAMVKMAKSVSSKVEEGRVYIKASYNNTHITVTDAKGNVIAWASAGSLGFSGPKKATPFAASKIIAAIAEKLKKSGPFNVTVYVNGVGGGRDSAVRSLLNNGFTILGIKDVTPIPHNGPKPKKARKI